MVELAQDLLSPSLGLELNLLGDCHCFLAFQLKVILKNTGAE